MGVQLMKNKHKYRTNVYLGKDNYEAINSLATSLGLSVSQVCSILLDTGLKVGQSLDRATKEAMK